MCFQARLKTLTETFTFPDITKTEFNNRLLHIFLKTIATNTPSHGTEFDIALRNHALRAHLQISQVCLADN